MPITRLRSTQDSPRRALTVRSRGRVGQAWIDIPPPVRDWDVLEPLASPATPRERARFGTAAYPAKERFLASSSRRFAPRDASWRCSSRSPGGVAHWSAADVSPVHKNDDLTAPRPRGPASACGRPAGTACAPDAPSGARAGAVQVLRGADRRRPSRQTRRRRPMDHRPGTADAKSTRRGIRPPVEGATGPGRGGEIRGDQR
jgi:hypothetical protein